MSKGLSGHERTVRIELARARAALERQEIARSLCNVRESLTPSALWHSLVPGLHGGRAAHSSGHDVGWLSRIADLSRRYPFLITGASAVLGSVGRRRSGFAWRLGLGALAGWKVLRRMQTRRNRLDGSSKRLPR